MSKDPCRRPSGGPIPTPHATTRTRAAAASLQHSSTTGEAKSPSATGGAVLRPASTRVLRPASTRTPRQKAAAKTHKLASENRRKKRGQAYHSERQDRTAAEGVGCRRGAAEATKENCTASARPQGCTPNRPTLTPARPSAVAPPPCLRAQSTTAVEKRLSVESIIFHIGRGLCLGAG